MLQAFVTLKPQSRNSGFFFFFWGGGGLGALKLLKRHIITTNATNYKITLSYCLKLSYFFNIQYL